MLINNFNTLIGLNNFIVIIDNKSNYFFVDNIFLTDLDIKTSNTDGNRIFFYFFFFLRRLQFVII